MLSLAEWHAACLHPCGVQEQSITDFLYYTTDMQSHMRLHSTRSLKYKTVLADFYLLCES